MLGTQRNVTCHRQKNERGLERGRRSEEVKRERGNGGNGRKEIGMDMCITTNGRGGMTRPE